MAKKKKEEVEIRPSKKHGYEIITLDPYKRFERVERDAGLIPQVQSLITEIIELIRSNQKIVNEVIRANTDLRNEISRLPPKLDDLTDQMRKFIGLVEAAGREEITTPGPESLKPLEDQLKKLVEQNQKLIENNQSILESLDSLGRKIKAGTPISQLLSSYPKLKLRKREVK
ncbi:MAG: hypothetical protein ACE5J4_01820 [Candidatus Aenigmatarchaeota archaeon]